MGEGMAIVRHRLTVGCPANAVAGYSLSWRTRRQVVWRYRLANTPPEKRKFLRKSQLWSEDFTAKLFCNVEFWLERLPKMTEPW
jgi:hypothetical protein